MGKVFAYKVGDTLRHISANRSFVVLSVRPCDENNPNYTNISPCKKCVFPYMYKCLDIESMMVVQETRHCHNEQIRIEGGE